MSRPFRARFYAAFIEAIQQRNAASVDIFEEVLETERFPGDHQRRLMMDYLKSKYAGRRMDVIVVVGTKALAFAREHRGLFGNPPIVAAVGSAGQVAWTRDDVTGLEGGSWIEGTIQLALALRPETRHVVVVDGTLENDGAIQAEVERQLARHSGRLSLTYLRDLPLREVVSRLSGMPRESIVLFARQTMRDHVQDLDTFEALLHVVRASRAPVFGPMEEYPRGVEVLGGRIWRLEDDARQMAGMTNRIMDGIRARDIPAGRATFADVIDARELARWHIPESQAPAGSTVLFRTPSFFVEYWRYVACRRADLRRAVCVDRESFSSSGPTAAARRNGLGTATSSTAASSTRRAI